MTPSPLPRATDDDGPIRTGRRRPSPTALTLMVGGLVFAGITTVVAGEIVAEPSAAPVAFVTQPDFQPGAKPPCVMHQTTSPNGPYEGGADSQSRPQLTFLAYYTAVGQKPFCDGRPATDTDRTWAKLYVQLTANPGNVSSILG